MRKSVLPSATRALGLGKVGREHVEDFTSSEGKKNSKIKKKKRRSVNHQRVCLTPYEERIRGRNMRYLKNER